MASIKKRPNRSWRARYRDADGKEHARHFRFKNNLNDPANSAEHWLDEVTAAVVTNTYVDPMTARLTAGEWAGFWLKSYESRRLSTVRRARVHVKRIVEKFGDRPVAKLRPSEVETWMAELQAEGLQPSFVYALHQRLGQLFSDAVHDGLMPRSPVS